MTPRGFPCSSPGSVPVVMRAVSHTAYCDLPRPGPPAAMARELSGIRPCDVDGMALAGLVAVGDDRDVHVLQVLGVLRRPLTGAARVACGDQPVVEERVDVFLALGDPDDPVEGLGLQHDGQLVGDEGDEPF